METFTRTQLNRLAAAIVDILGDSGGGFMSISMLRMATRGRLAVEDDGTPVYRRENMEWEFMELKNAVVGACNAVRQFRTIVEGMPHE